MSEQSSQIKEKSTRKNNPAARNAAVHRSAESVRNATVHRSAETTTNAINVRGLSMVSCYELHIDRPTSKLKDVKFGVLYVKFGVLFLTSEQHP